MTALESSPRRRGLWAVAPLGVGLLAAGLGTIGIRRSFTLAEVEAVLQSHHGWKGLVPFWHADASGALYLVFLKGWLHAGSSEWVVRAPSVAATGLTAVIVCLLGTRLVDRRTGLVAGILFAVSAFTTATGRTAAPLAFSLLAATLVTWLFVLALESGNPLLWALYALTAAAAVYAHASSVLVLVAHVVALVVSPRLEVRATAVAGVIVAVAAAPVVVQVLADPRHVIDALEQPSLRDAGRAVHDAAGRNLVLLGLAVAGGAALLLRRGTRIETWQAALLASWAAAPLPFLLVLSIARPSLDERYLTVATPPVALLAGVALTRLLRREAAAVLAVATLVLAAVRIVQLQRTSLESWRAATAYALAARKEGDRVVVAPPRALAAFSYYAGPDRGSLVPGGPTALVIVRALAADDALEIARRAARAPAYALRDERRFGRHLGVERWDRTGLPAR